MTESESVALPLGDAAMFIFVLSFGRLALRTCTIIADINQFDNIFIEFFSYFFRFSEIVKT